MQQFKKKLKNAPTKAEALGFLCLGSVKREVIVWV